MNEQKNVQVIRDAYAAFGRGDIPALLNLMADDVDWHTYGPKELPMSGRRLGKPEVKRFFQEVGETWNFDRFEPREFIAQGETVVSLGYYNGTAKATGRKFESEFSHVFTIGNGKITRFREYTDTANMVQALSKATARV